MGVLALLSLGLGAGCRGESAGGPPEIRYGEHECDRCRMIISEERTAAAALSEGAELRFDDLGCLRAWVRSPQGRDSSIWVHDAITLEWLPGPAAAFVRVPELVTPMGTGWLALRDPSRAASRYPNLAEGPLDWREFSGEDGAPGRKREPAPEGS